MLQAECHNCSSRLLPCRCMPVPVSTLDMQMATDTCESMATWWPAHINHPCTDQRLAPLKGPMHLNHVPGRRRHLHRDAKSLVQSADAATLVGAHDAVHEALELAVPAALAKVGAKPRPRKVQWVHDQQGPGTCQATCAHMQQHESPTCNALLSMIRRNVKIGHCSLWSSGKVSSAHVHTRASSWAQGCRIAYDHSPCAHYLL